MAPCGQNYVTPTMIKKGQISIGDRIQFDDDILVNGPASEHDSVSQREEVEVSVSAPVSISAAESEAAVSAPGPEAETAEASSIQLSEASAPDTTETASMYPAAAQNQIMQQPTPAQSQMMQQSTPAQNQMMQQSAPIPSPGSADTTRPNPWANLQGQNSSGTNAAIPLIYEEMTNYAQYITTNSGNTPNFGVPAHPMVPPEYDQSVDYDSVQYMNGFLRTQIGRGVLVQQLIGSGNSMDRYGYLVGVGNNYLLLQDFSNDNILLIDFYTVKYVYIYYSQPSFPSFPQPINQQ